MTQLLEQESKRGAGGEDARLEAEQEKAPPPALNIHKNQPFYLAKTLKTPRNNWSFITFKYLLGKNTEGIGNLLEGRLTQLR